jgi:hypothetical protein
MPDNTFSVCLQTIKWALKIESNERFFVNVTNVSAANVSNSQGVGNIQNDDSPTLSINDVTQAEGNAGTSTFTFAVTSSLPAPADGINFTVNTTAGTASAGSDYVTITNASGSILAGSSSTIINVTINGDQIVEPNETFFVNLSNVTNATLADGQGLGTITNDDTPLLVISQVYGGGGNASATYTSDFIEIFNRGTTTIDFSVTPYSVQYAAATSNFSTNKTDITSGTLLPGHYFLIQEASGGANGAALPTPDISSGTINMSAHGRQGCFDIGNYEPERHRLSVRRYHCGLSWLRHDRELLRDFSHRGFGHELECALSHTYKWLQRHEQ